MNGLFFNPNRNRFLIRACLALSLVLALTLGLKRSWAQSSPKIENPDISSTANNKVASTPVLKGKVLAWDSESLVHLIHTYLRPPISIPPKLKLNIDTNLKKLGLFGEDLELFTPSFSLLTQGRFKQVSASLLLLLKPIDTKSINHISQELMQYEELRKQAYSLYFSYALLDQHHEWTKESMLMMYSLMNDPFFEGPAHLNLRFKERVGRYLRQLHDEIAFNQRNDQGKHLEAIKTIKSLDSKQLIAHIGFWLRREQDQSRVTLYRFLKDAVQVHLNGFMLKALSQVPVSSLGLRSETLNQVYTPLLRHNKNLGSKIDPYLGDLEGFVTREGLNQGVLEALNHEMVKQYSAPSKKLESVKLWEIFSTYRLERPYEAHEKKRPFLFWNPRFIFWFNDHLIPNASTPVLLGKLQRLYQLKYKRLFDLLLNSHHYLKNNLDVNKEKLAYSLSRFMTNYDEEGYLERRYIQVLKQSFPEEGIAVFTPAKAIGFWLKRELDGSAEYVWMTLNNLRSHLDPKVNQSEISR